MPLDLGNINHLIGIIVGSIAISGAAYKVAEIKLRGLIFEQIAKAMRDQSEQMANAIGRNNELVMSSINNLTGAIARVEKQQEDMNRTIAVMSVSLATVSAETSTALKRADALERRVERLESGGPGGGRA